MELVDLLSAALTPITAILALFIAYQQLRIQRAANRLQLYERRFRVYLAYRHLLSHLVFSPHPDQAVVERLSADVGEAKFLFEPSDASIIWNAVDMARELIDVDQTRQGKPTSQFRYREYSATSLLRTDGELRNRAWQELQSLDTRFAKYMAFR